MSAPASERLTRDFENQHGVTPDVYLNQHGCLPDDYVRAAATARDEAFGHVDPADLHPAWREPVARTLPDDVERDVSGPMFDRFAAGDTPNGATPHHQPTTRTAQVEIIDSPAALAGNRQPIADSYGFTPGLSAPPERARLTQGEIPLHAEDFAAAAELRDMKAVPIGRNAMEQPNSRPRSYALADDPVWQQTGPDRQRTGAHTSELDAQASPAHPAAWRDAYTTQAQVAASARERGLPVDREMFERNLEDKLDGLHRERAGAEDIPPEHRRGLPLPYERELPTRQPLSTDDQDEVAPELRRGLLRAGDHEYPTFAGISTGTTGNNVAPEHQRGLPLPYERELPPPPVKGDALPTALPSHDHEVLERHGLADLVKPDAADDTPADADRQTLAEYHEAPAKSVDDATAERTTDRPTEEADRPAVPDNTREPGREASKEPIDEPAPKPAEEPTPGRQEPDATPDVKPEAADKPAPESVPDDKPGKSAEPESTGAEPEPGSKPEPAAEETAPEPDHEPRHWEADAVEMTQSAEPETAHSDPEPEAPSHYMGPEL
jgi:hypothetical protein